MAGLRAFIAVALAALISTAAYAQTDYLAADSTSVVAEDIPYRVAFFHQQKGEFEKGLLVLARASRAAASAEVNQYRDMLAGHLNVELKRYEEAERLLAPLSNPQAFFNYNAQVLYPLARAYYGKSQCEKVLDILNRAQGFPAEISAHVMYLRINCMVQNAKDSSVISEAENIINVALLDKTKANRMWFAYAYFNVASAAAGSFNYYHDADRLFNEALKYIDKSKEGRALKERTLLNIGFANFADNRFDYATEAFSLLPVEGIWADVSLLAYGWASINVYKTDLAIESWRQLISLPYRSASVYEGYMAIPSAYEKAGSYSDALRAYDEAIAEFIKVVGDIDKLSTTLTRQKIHDYAVLYSLDDTANVSQVLTPLLARTYTEDNLRGLVELIGSVEHYKTRLNNYEKVLLQLQVKGGISGVSQALNNMSSLRAQTNTLLMKLETALLEQTLSVLEQQKQRILQYTLEARVANARLQEEFFQRGGRRLWR
jgi:tetratricopeptide (TPR) repeat protein